MRTENSIKNSITSLLGNGISFIIAFIAQGLFIRILGVEYLGLNGLFANILTMLSIFELGIGNAIVYNLYKPIANNDKKNISALMNFYKKVYRIIALLIFISAILIMPFIKYMLKDVFVDVNIYIIYILFLCSTLTSYFMAYKRNLIIANQINYVINIIHMVYLISVNILQILLLYITKNYYLFLVVKIICQLLENIAISMYATKKFPYLLKNNNEKISKKTELDIFSRVKALIFHKVAGIIISGTDNILISKFFGLVSVGLYNNYYVIINGITIIFSQVISTSTASVGNLLVSERQEKRYDTFKKMRFLNAWISVFTAVALLLIIQPFISIWVGKEYQLEMFFVLVIVFNYFQKIQRQVYCTFKDSAGIWREDKYVPLVESALNIIFSIICLKMFGLTGIFIGTIISGLALWCYSYPKFVYKKLFNRSYIDYVKETVGYILLFVFIAIITYGVSLLVIVDNNLLQVIINTILCLIVPNMLMIIIFRKTENYKYFKELLFKIINKIFKKITKAH